LPTEIRGAIGALCFFGRAAQCQDAGQMSLQIDGQCLSSGAIGTRVQDDALDQAPDDLGSFLAAAFIIQRLGSLPTSSR
jgi:hypothetical protein